MLYKCSPTVAIIIFTAYLCLLLCDLSVFFVTWYFEHCCHFPWTGYKYCIYLIFSYNNLCLLLLRELLWNCLLSKIILQANSKHVFIKLLSNSWDLNRLNAYDSKCFPFAISSLAVCLCEVMVAELINHKHGWKPLSGDKVIQELSYHNCEGHLRFNPSKHNSKEIENCIEPWGFV